MGASGKSPPSTTGCGLQVPGVLSARSRPEQVSPAEQSPLRPVPQQGCPSAPQAAHTFAVGARMHSWGSVQAATPPSTRAPPVVGQQSWSKPPHGEQVPAVLSSTLRPVHTKPALQVPVSPVPQQDSPEPPQVPHTLPVALTTQDSASSVQGLRPSQQACPSAPQGVQVPAVPAEASLPVQEKPVSHVPVLPVPQQA